jgi:CheY-like chemotaxis protein
MPASALTGMHVLLIDDVPDSRELARFVLEQAGAIVVAVASAQMALDQLCPTAPDVIISDVGMPDMNGLDLIRRIRQNFAEFRNTPAIALTAYATHEQQQQALEAGYDRHLAKPIDPTTLVETVAQFIDRNN